MKIRLIAVAAIMISGILAITFGPGFELINYVDKSTGVPERVSNVFGIVFSTSVIIGLALVCLGIIGLLIQNEKIFTVSLLTASIAFIVGAVCLKYFIPIEYQLVDIDPAILFIVLCAAISFTTGIAHLVEDAKITLAIGIAGIFLGTVVFLPAFLFSIPSLDTTELYTIINRSILDSVSRIKSVNALSTVFIVLSIIGVMTIIRAILEAVRGNKEFFISGLIYGGVVTIAGVLFHFIILSLGGNLFNIMFLKYGVILILFCGVASLSIGLFARHSGT